MHILSIPCVIEISPDNEQYSSVLLGSYLQRRLTWQTCNIKDALQRKYKEKGVCKWMCMSFTAKSDKTKLINNVGH